MWCRCKLIFQLWLRFAYLIYGFRYFGEKTKQKVILNGFSLEGCGCGLSCNLSLEFDENFVLDLLFLGVVCCVLFYMILVCAQDFRDLNLGMG